MAAALKIKADPVPPVVKYFKDNLVGEARQKCKDKKSKGPHYLGGFENHSWIVLGASHTSTAYVDVYLRSHSFRVPWKRVQVGSATLKADITLFLKAEYWVECLCKKDGTWVPKRAIAQPNIKTVLATTFSMNTVLTPTTPISRSKSRVLFDENTPAIEIK